MMKKASKIINTKNFLLTSLFLVAFLERTVFDLGANIELVTTALIIASLYFGRKEAFWLTLSIMATTDRIIGNTPILLFTWSGFLIPALIASRVIQKIGISGVRKYLSPTSVGAGANIFFFLWTNFGVWLMDVWGMYPKTLTGLILSYINGLPFLRNQLISSFMFIPLGIFAVELSRLIYTNHSPSLIKFYRKVATS